MRTAFLDLGSARHRAINNGEKLYNSVKKNMGDSFDITQKDMSAPLEQEEEHGIRCRDRQTSVQRCSFGVLRMSPKNLKDLVMARRPSVTHENISNCEWEVVLEDFRATNIPPRRRRVVSKDHLETQPLKSMEDSMNGVSDITSFTELGTFDDSSFDILEGDQDEDRIFSEDRWLALEGADPSGLGGNGFAPLHGLVAPARRDSMSSILSHLTATNQTCVLPPLMPTRRHSMGSVSLSRVDTALPYVPRRQESVQELEKRRAQFGFVQVRFYEREIEVNPSVSNGVAVGIGWGYECEKDLPIDEWEARKTPAVLRSNRDLVLPRHIRERMVLDAGFTQREIARAMRQILKAKHQRKVTIKQLAIQKYTEKAIKRATRKLKEILSFRRAKRSNASTDSSSSEGVTDGIFR